LSIAAIPIHVFNGSPVHASVAPAVSTIIEVRVVLVFFVVTLGVFPVEVFGVATWPSRALNLKNALKTQKSKIRHGRKLGLAELTGIGHFYFVLPILTY